MDLGCGSGVLAIAAAKLGFGPVAGIDHERESVAATDGERRGQRRRASRSRATTSCPTAPRRRPPRCSRTSCARCCSGSRADGFAAGAVPRTLIASGLLAHEADEVAAAFGAAMGLVERDRRLGGEWAALLLERAVAK